MMIFALRICLDSHPETWYNTHMNDSTQIENDLKVKCNQAEILANALKEREAELTRAGEAIFELRRENQRMARLLSAIDSNRYEEGKK